MIKKIFKEFEKLQVQVDSFLEKFFEQLESTSRPSVKEIKSLVNESEVRWVKFARQIISLKRRDSISSAIINAQRINEAEVVQMLEFFRKKPQKKEDSEKIQLLCGNLSQRFESEGRTEESLTSLLLGLYYKMILAENFANCPVEQQLSVLAEGIEAGESGIQITKLLGDIACQAKFLVKTGNCLSRCKQFSEAEIHFQKALEIYRKLAAVEPTTFKLDLGGTLRDLGMAQWDLLNGEAAEISLREALAIYRNFGMPEKKIVENYKFISWATGLDKLIQAIMSLAIYEDLVQTLTFLSQILFALKKFDEAEILCLEVLEINQRSEIPLSIIPSCNILSSIKIEQKKWKEGESYLRLALAQIEELRSETLELGRRQQIIENNVKVFDSLVVCLINQGNYTEAFEIAEQAKGRTFADLLSMQEFRPQNVTDELWQTYRQNIQRIQHLETLLSPENLRELQQRNDDSISENIANDNHIQNFRSQVGEWKREINEARQQRDQFFVEFRKLDPDYLPAAVPLKFFEMQELASKTNKTLVMFRVTHYETYVFFLFPDGNCETLAVPDFTIQELDNLLIRRDEDGEAIGGWIYRYYEYLSARPHAVKRAKAQKDWLVTIERTLQKLHIDLVGEVCEVLRRNSDKMRTNDVVIIPNRGLAVLPLHAATWLENGEPHYFNDEYNINYAPSIYSFKRCFERDSAIQMNDKLFLLANPTNDLDFATEECNKIFQILSKTHAISILPLKVNDVLTKADVIVAMSRNNWLHFSCHGYYEMNMPLQSKLLLKLDEHTDDESSVLLSDIMKIDLRHVWLTVLSACETGLTDYRESSDEYVGFPFGFILAGVSSVWGTLYSVDDESTKELMILAYKNLKCGISKGEALTKAQLEMRKSTKYSHPFYWSAFHSVGV